MKFFVVVSFLFAAVCAAPCDQLDLGYPLRDFYAYMKCVPQQADESTKNHGCNAIWEEYRQDYLNKVTDFEDCANRPTENEADACRYKSFANSDNVLSLFYYKLYKSKDRCHRVVPLAILECQSDDMRYSPDF